jgi:DNA-binding MarR family transcriptional regulator
VDRPPFDESDRPAETRNVTLSPRELRDAVRLLRRLVEGDVDPVAFERAEAAIADRQTLIKRARRMLLERRKRVDLFGSGMFGEAAWDILLILYAEQENMRLTVARLTELSGHSASTALRWMETLEARGLIERLEHPTDRRALFVTMTRRGFDALDLYFSETLLIQG